MQVSMDPVHRQWLWMDGRFYTVTLSSQWPTILINDPDRQFLVPRYFGGSTRDRKRIYRHPTP